MVRKREKHPAEEQVNVLQEVHAIEEKELTGKIIPIAPVQENKFNKEGWKPRTELGRKVKEGEIVSLDNILYNGLKMLEPEIVDCLVPNIISDFLLVGQSKGKFGGGKRTIWRQTQKKTKEGNKPKFAIISVVGNKEGYVGVGIGKSKETVPAREKAIRNAKLNIINVKRGCGSWACGCRQIHSIPFKVTGRCGSVGVTLMPAPKGTGLVTEKEISKILALAGIKDVYSKTSGQTRTKMNLIYACFDALKNLSKIKIGEEESKKIGLA